MKILTAQQMRDLDRMTVERCGIPYATLMETAGSRVVEAIIETYGPVADKSFAVFCGKGNNGGDGAVIARLLFLRGAKVKLFLFGKIEDTKGEARTNFESVKLFGEPIVGFGNGKLFFEEITTEEDAWFVYTPDFFVDALFGTGLTRDVEGLYAQAIATLNRNVEDCYPPATVIAVDIPSGVLSDSGTAPGFCVRADLTVSFTAPKIGNVLSPACEVNGKLVIASIGTPGWLIHEGGSQLELVEESEIRWLLNKSRRMAYAHKNSVGDVLLIAGSRGKTGAAALASESVLRAGAGLVTVATAKSAQTLLVTQTKSEVMTEALAETFDGAIAQEAVEHVLRLAEKKTVLAVGPGLSSAEDSTRHFVRELVERRTVPMVIDADGLNALAPWPDELKGSDELPIIITPHPGEMARLTGKTNAEVQSDRIGNAREFATTHHVVTVLKGSRSLIAAPDGNVYVNPTGNAGMATAGSGDVLTGLIAGLLAQSPKGALEATIASVYLHGLAGDLAAENLGLRSMIASDIIGHLSEAILQVGGEEEKGRRLAIDRL
ncbi:MAG: NAD(P)H-hydrate dehydratase [Acidobacteria bacterium]|nr:NAD(P)H-hydrate dehydratase [Acidobacteriota bacterium]